MVVFGQDVAAIRALSSSPSPTRTQDKHTQRWHTLLVGSRDVWWHSSRPSAQTAPPLSPFVYANQTPAQLSRQCAPPHLGLFVGVKGRMCCSGNSRRYDSIMRAWSRGGGSSCRPWIVCQCDVTCGGACTFNEGFDGGSRVTTSLPWSRPSLDSMVNCRSSLLLRTWVKDQIRVRVGEGQDRASIQCTTAALVLTARFLSTRPLVILSSRRSSFARRSARCVWLSS